MGPQINTIKHKHLLDGDFDFGLLADFSPMGELLQQAHGACCLLLLASKHGLSLACLQCMRTSWLACHSGGECAGQGAVAATVGCMPMLAELQRASRHHHMIV